MAAKAGRRNAHIAEAHVALSAAHDDAIGAHIDVLRQELNRDREATKRHLDGIDRHLDGIERVLRGINARLAQPGNQPCQAVNYLKQRAQNAHADVWVPVVNQAGRALL